MEPANINPNNNIVRNWLMGVGAALVVLVGITFVFHTRETLSPVIAGAESTTTGSTSTPIKNNPGTFATAAGTMTTPSMGEIVSVEDQRAGSSVVITSMTLARKSWIAIKDTHGSILGAGLFPANATSGSVSLLRKTTAGGRYEVLIYVDNGDKAFELRKDTLVTSSDGSPVSTAFNAQ